jgi:hypothetical protein
MGLFIDADFQALYSETLYNIDSPGGLHRCHPRAAPAQPV